MFKAPSSEREDFGVLLARAYVVFVDELRTAMAEAGYDDLHPSFGYVVRAVAERPLTLRELADRLGITSQGALKIVDDLETRGYLHRQPDPVDGRARRLHLSPRGQAALAEARKFHRRFEREVSKRTGRDLAEQGRRLLEDIVRSREEDGRAAALRPV